MVSQHAVHDITVAAPPGRVYDLLADAAGWPALFPPTVHAEATPLGDGQERLRLWATANGGVKAWTSLRDLDPVTRRITFRQEVFTPPVAAMGGEWHVEETTGGHSRVRLTHTYSAVGDDPAGLAWIDSVVWLEPSLARVSIFRCCTPAGSSPSSTLTTCGSRSGQCCADQMNACASCAEPANSTVSSKVKSRDGSVRSAPAFSAVSSATLLRSIASSIQARPAGSSPSSPR